MSKESEICRACGHEIMDNYCSNCGEKRYRRLGIRDLMSDALDETVSFEFPLIKSLKGLWTKPGKTIREFIDGDRKSHYRPMKMYLFFLTIYLLFFYVLTSGFEDFYNWQSVEDSIDTSSTQQEILLERIKAVQQYLFQWLIFLQIPINSLLTYLFFRKAKFSFIEHLNGNLFILSQTLIFSILQSIFMYLNPGAIMAISFVLTVFYHAWSYKGWFEVSWVHASLKSILIFCVSLFLFGLVIVLISVPYAMMTV